MRLSATSRSKTGFVAYQLRPFGGRWPVLGSWLVNGWACGVGIREDGSLITRNASRFLPHKMVSL